MTGEITRGERLYRWTLTPGDVAGELRVRCIETGWLKLATVRPPGGDAWTDDYAAGEARRLLEEAYTRRGRDGTTEAS